MTRDHHHGGPINDLLRTGRLIDLTQPLGPQTSLWPGSAPFVARITKRHDPDGIYFRTITAAEHSGTHLDAPSHFNPDGAHVDDLPLTSLVRPAVCIDVRDACGDNPEFAVTAEHVERFELEAGTIEAGTAVLVCTGWDRYRDDAERYIGITAPACPGLGPDAAGLLVERGIVGIGIDTLGVDVGSSVTFPTHHLTLGAGLWHLEGLINLDAVPARGAWVVVGVPPVVDGSGAPARVFAIAPGEAAPR